MGELYTRDDVFPADSQGPNARKDSESYVLAEGEGLLLELHLLV